LHYAFLDESGTTAPLRPGDGFLVVVALVGDQSSSRALELHLKRLRQRTRTRPGGELKATYATQKQRLRLLQVVSSARVSIVAVVVDKRMAQHVPRDPEDWYRQAVGLAVRHCVDHWPQTHVILDKRYTNKTLRDKLDDAILVNLRGAACGGIAIEHKESSSSSGLQVADYIAWAVRRKYDSGDREGYDLIASRIVTEQVIEAK
jgi:hypothetical protein